MAEPEKPSSDVFDLARIQDLIMLMKEHDLMRIELRQGDQQIRLSRGGAPIMGGMPSMVSFPASAPPPSSPSPVVEDESHLVVIKSPMVGTYYARPNPNAPQFVKVGDHIEPETTVCIIEAMKVFNEIPAEVRGKIAAVLVDDEEPVDFGKPLFKVDTRG